MTQLFGVCEEVGNEQVVVFGLKPQQWWRRTPPTCNVHWLPLGHCHLPDICPLESYSAAVHRPKSDIEAAEPK